MPVGFECYNDGGVLQITDQYKGAMYLRKSGVVTEGDFIHGSPGSAASYTLSTKKVIIPLGQDFSCPFVFLRSTNGVSACYGMIKKNGANYHLEIGALYGHTGSPTLAPFSIWTVSPIYYYIFDTTVPARGNVGMEIFDENGVLRYNTEWQPLKITDIVNVPWDKPASYPSGKWSGMFSVASDYDMRGYNVGSFTTGTPAFSSSEPRKIICHPMPSLPNTPSVINALGGYFYGSSLYLSHIPYTVGVDPHRTQYHQSSFNPPRDVRILIANVSFLPVPYN